MKLNGVIDMEIKFGIHVILHEIYSSIYLNNIPCEVVDLEYKVVKKNLSFDLAKLLLNHLSKNMESIQVSRTIHVSSILS